MVDTAYSNPGGMGDRTADITVSMTGGAYTGTLQSIVDGDYGTGIGLVPGATNWELKFDFGSGADPVIDGIRIWWLSHVHNASMGAFVFEYSDNDSTWTSAHSNPDSVFLMAAAEEGPTVQAVEIAGFLQNTTGHRYWRIRGIKASNPPSSPEIREIEFRINSSAGTPDPPPDPPPDPDYTEPGGTGDRRALIWVSQNLKQTAFGGDASALIDGDGSTPGLLPSQNQASGNLIFDFGPSGFKQRITEFRWKQSGVQSFGNWQIFGSDDPTTWTLLGGPFDLGALAATDVHPFTNTGFYRFYRLRRQSGSDFPTEGEAWNEIEFKIAAGDPISEGLPVYDSGDRTADITVSTDATLASGTPSDLVDGSASNEVQFASGQTAKTIQFDFELPQVVNELSVSFSASSWSGYVRVWASNTPVWPADPDPAVDGYDLIGGPLALQSGFPLAGFSGNLKGYRSYRIVQVEGTLDDFPFVREITFRRMEGLPPATDCFAYANEGGQGNRTVATGDGSVVPTLLAGSLTNGTIDQLVNGTIVNTEQVQFANSNWEVQFDFGVPKVIKQVSFIWVAGDWPSGLFVQWSGSNDGSTWVDIGPPEDRSGGIVNEVALGFFRTVSVSMQVNDLPFRYYRMRRTAYVSGTFTMGEIRFFIGGTSAGIPIGSYDYTGGQGDRTAQITVSYDGTISSGTIDNLIDGTALDNATYGVLFGAGENGKIIHFDFGAPVLIDQTRVNAFCPGTNFHGEHFFEGSNDDANWTTVEPNWHAGLGFSGLWTQDLTSPNYYRFYRIRHNPAVKGNDGVGGWQSSIYVNEFFFRLAPLFSSPDCPGVPVDEVHLDVVFIDEAELDASIAPPPPTWSATFTDEGDFIITETVIGWNPDPVVFEDEADLTATPTITPGTADLGMVNFDDDAELYARESHEPIVPVQSVLIASGR